MTSKFAAIGELVTVVVPSPNRYISSSKMSRKGLRSGNTRIVTGTDPSARGGFQFEGQFIGTGENEIAVGAVILEQEPERHWCAGVILPNGSISWYYGLSSGEELVALRKRIEACLENPMQRFQEIRAARARALADIEAQSDAKAADIERRRERLASMEAMLAFLDAGGVGRERLRVERQQLMARLSEIDQLLAN